MWFKTVGALIGLNEYVPYTIKVRFSYVLVFGGTNFSTSPPHPHPPPPRTKGHKVEHLCVAILEPLSLTFYLLYKRKQKHMDSYEVIRYELHFNLCIVIFVRLILTRPLRLPRWASALK